MATKKMPHSTKVRLTKMILRYRQTQNQHELEEILKVADTHLVTCVNLMKRKYQFLKQEDSEDLYGYCIIGLIKVTRSLRPDHPIHMIDTRIWQYAKAEVFSVFKKMIRDRYKLCKVLCPIETADDNSSSEQQILFGDFEGKIQELIRARVLDPVDYKMVVLRFSYGLPYTKIAEKVNLHQDTVGIRIRNCVQIIKQHLDVGEYIHNG